MKLSKKWFFALAEGENGRTVFVNGRIGIAEHRGSGKYPVRVDIFWKYDEDAEGLPSAEESKSIEAWGDAVRRAMEKNKLAICVLKATGDGEASWSYYTRYIEAFQKTLNESTTDFPTFPIRCHAERDPEWEAYDEVLTLESEAIDKREDE